VRYFFDNCISYRLAHMLRALGVDVVALKEHCPANTPDTDLFKILSGSDFVFVSEDRKQLTRIAEASELKSAGISAIYFGPFWSKMGFWKQAEFLVRRWELIDGAQKGLAKGTIVELKQNGKAIPVNP